MIFADASEDTKDVGKCIEIINLNGEKLLSGLHTILARKKYEIAKGFPAYLFQSTAVREQIILEAQGAKVYGITAKRISGVIISLPTLPEQKKIADCLSSLDELIEATSRKAEKLKKYKKGLMQKLFPRQGEKVPSLRFPEFQNAPAWEEKKLGEIVEVLNNLRKPVTSTDRDKGIYPYYGASGIQDYVSSYLFDERLLLVGEDGAKWGANERTAFIADGKYWVNNHAHVLRSEGSDSFLENWLIYLDLSPFVTGAAPPKLTLGNLKKIPVPSPSFFEQQKIADCLSSLDELIEGTEEKAEQLKIYKKGLMQKLFP